MVFKPKDRDELKEAIDLLCNDEENAFTKYCNINE